MGALLTVLQGAGVILKVLLLTLISPVKAIIPKPKKDVSGEVSVCIDTYGAWVRNMNCLLRSQGPGFISSARTLLAPSVG